MNIGVDFDGVLFDSESMLRSAAAIFNNKINHKDMKYHEELKGYKRYQWSKDIEQKFLNNNLLEILKTAPIMPYAKQVLTEIKNAGHQLYAITSRGLIYPDEINITNQRLKEENIMFDKIFFSVDNKLDICKENNVDIMIDDLYDTIKNLSENGIDCLYYRDLVLKFYNNHNVKEVRNWGDIYVEFKKRGVL